MTVQPDFFGAAPAPAPPGYPDRPGWKGSDTSRAEEWRCVPGYELTYEASSLGRVRSRVRPGININRTYGGRVLVPNTSGERALVTLSQGNAVTTEQVHVLVCRAFHGPKPEDKDVTAHWDGDPWNNRPENLRWATFLENEDDKRRHDRHAIGERNPAHKLTAEQVAEIRRRYVPKYGAGAALAREFAVSTTQICDIVKGRCWSDEGNAARRVRRRAAKGLIEDSAVRGTAMGGRHAIVWRVVA